MPAVQQLICGMHMGIDVTIGGGKNPPLPLGPAKTGTIEEITKINETIIAANSFFLID